MYTLEHLTLPNLVLYGDEAEDIMSNYLDFRDAYVSYSAVFLPMDMENAKSTIHQFGEMQLMKEESGKLRKQILESKNEVEKQTLQEQVTGLEVALVKVLASIKQVDEVIDSMQPYKPEKRETIKQAEKDLKDIITEMLSAISSCLKKENKDDNSVTLKDLKTLSKGGRLTLIMDIAREPLNGINGAFLASLEKIVQVA